MSGSNAEQPRSPSSGPNRRRDLLIGLAVVLPVGLMALLVYDFASTIVSIGAGLVGLLRGAGIEEPLLIGAVLGALALALPIALVGVGIVVRHRYGQRVVGTVDRTIESIPGLGPVYTGLRRSREVLASPDGEAFAGVVRVRMDEGVHALAFRVDSSAHETAGGQPAPTAADGGAESATDGDRDGDAGPAETAADEPTTDDATAGVAPAESHVDALAADGLATVFLPFAPNPIVGGHLLTVEIDRIEPAGLTVPQALGVLVGLGSHEEPKPNPDAPFSSFYVNATNVEDAAAGDEA